MFVSDKANVEQVRTVADLGGNVGQRGAVEEDAEGNDDGIAQRQVGTRLDGLRAAGAAVLHVCHVVRAHQAQIRPLCRRYIGDQRKPRLQDKLELPR